MLVAPDGNSMMNPTPSSVVSSNALTTKAAFVESAVAGAMALTAQLALLGELSWSAKNSNV
jgi:hypothetical protein